MYIRMVKSFADIQSAIEEVLATSWSLGSSDLTRFESCKTFEDIHEALKSLAAEWEDFGFPTPYVSLETDGWTYEFQYETASGTNKVLLIWRVPVALCNAIYYVESSHANEDPYESSAVKSFREAGWVVWDWE